MTALQQAFLTVYGVLAGLGILLAIGLYLMIEHLWRNR
jgi:hypothetical protein